MLHAIGALDESGQCTPHGAAIARLPLPPRLAHMVLAAPKHERRLAARLAILLTEQGLGGRDPDMRVRLDRFARERGQRAEAARALADRVARQTGGDQALAEDDRAGVLLALAYPDRVAKRRGEAFLLANGRAAHLDDTSTLAREMYLVVADLAGQAGRAQILLAAPIQEADVESLFADKIELSTTARVDPASGAARARRARMLGSIVLSEAPLERLSGADLRAALLNAVADGGLDLLNWTDAARQLRARVAFLRSLEADEWPDWSDAALLGVLNAWLEPALEGVESLRAIDVTLALLNTLPYATRQRLDQEAPARFETPAGSSLAIDYEAEGGPALDVRLQEMFGETRHPSIARGRVPLSLRLLSPAHRPVQTTKDLPGFWRGSYAGVRSDMRGRYPKHPWPEDPTTAQPTRRAKPRGS
jgi:ATP-dependent helicase HrpB